MSAPETLEEFAAIKARVVLIEANLRHSLQSETMQVQLAALLSAYVNLAAEHGQLHYAGQCLLNTGAALIAEQLNAAAPAASAPSESAPPNTFFH